MRAVFFLATIFLAVIAPSQAQTVWKFDNLVSIGGAPTHAEGHPQLIDTPAGKAIQFNGVNDALFIDRHPLAGASTFTWEAIFRPDGGHEEQRWFHLEENPATGSDQDSRMLFEIRVIQGKWCLDAFNRSGTVQKALLNRSRLHKLGAWHHVAAVYDGVEFRNYVDGVEEGSAQIHLMPQGPGRAAVGMRLNKLYYFKGAVHLARFTRRALMPSEFLKVSGKP